MGIEQLLFAAAVVAGVALVVVALAAPLLLGVPLRRYYSLRRVRGGAVVPEQRIGTDADVDQSDDADSAERPMEDAGVRTSG